MWTIALILVALVAFCFGVGGFLFFTACKRANDINWNDENSVKKSQFSEHSDKLKLGNQWLRDHEKEDIYMVAPDGVRLHALWIPAPNAKATVVVAHGYHSCGLLDFSVALEMYHREGFHILMPSQRAHGASEGKYITFGVKESQDFLHWIRLHNARFGEYPIICSGLSMGASTLMFLAGLDIPDNVRGFIADCGFTSPKEIIAEVFRCNTHLPAWPFMWATELFARIFGKFSLSDMHTTKTLANNHRPILMVHGLADSFVPAEMTQRSFAACGGDKQLLLVEDATHAMSFLVAREAYLNKREVLLEKALGDIL